MRFQTRNLYYLRISATTVIPLYLYLDERHVEWMSERVLQHVLSDLRPLILPKLNAEADAHLGPGGPANAKKGTLDVHRGDSYQFGYFLRGTEPHAVLIKTRTFTAAPRPTSHGNAPVATSSSRQQNTVADKTVGKKRKPRARQKGKGKARAAEDDTISISSEDEARTDNGPLESVASRRPKRARKVPAGGYAEEADDDMVGNEQASPGHEPVQSNDHPMGGEEPLQDTLVIPKSEETEPSLGDLPASPADVAQEDEIVEQSAMDVEFVDDEEDVKPKPILKLNYHGFTIHGRCLCVIVEPYPPIRSGTRAPSLAPTGLIAPRAPSIAPPDFIPSGGAARRERTPLFLPDFDREPTPAPAGARNLPPVPLFNEIAEGSDEDEGEDGGMVLFSQILRSVGDHPPGIAEDDDEIDGAVFFGDADEMREL
ncbi:hypothetical protein PYCCODRAFT_1476230 [Trametes coccinea BRFM310]|uniref:Uncharacterized protein n=1 Tax=Trametes coccinea (strain BRFM310) TaxID=1353009 RepID=A0A1Y2IST0_TRAC3|nr:hypothetical protein PYCCODRAFT_1476230 [Trametes coccinea BRFM310]